jgi:DNA repair ATPase RecN
VKNLDTILLENAYDKVQNLVGSLGNTARTGALKRSAMMASQGRYPEAEGILRQYIKDPAKFKLVADEMKKKLTPIAGASSSKLEADPKYSEWLDKGWIPWVEKHI